MESYLDIIWKPVRGMVDDYFAYEKNQTEENLNKLQNDLLNLKPKIMMLKNAEITQFYELLCNEIARKNFFKDPSFMDEIENLYEVSTIQEVRCFFAGFLSKIFILLEKPNLEKLWEEKRKKEECRVKTLTPLQRKLEEYVNREKTLAYYYIKQHYLKRKHSKIKDYLLILKGWSSATPLMLTKQNGLEISGGGFYIHYNGVGIAVDPGCNYLHSLHLHDLQIFDIDIVIVTHNHMDHMNDVHALRSLNYECNSLIERYSKEDSFKRNSKTHQIKWYVDEELYKKLCDDEDFDKRYLYFVKSKKSGHSKEPYSEETAIELKTCNGSERDDSKKMSLITFLTEHKINASFGFKLAFSDERHPQKKMTIGYTSDTRYEADIIAHLSNSDILIANISELSKKDLENDFQENDKHLRLNGCKKSIKKCKPNLFLVSEFWGGKGDIRILVTKLLQQYIEDINEKKESDHDPILTKVLPADIGLKIYFQSIIENQNVLEIECSICKQAVHFESVEVIGSSKPYGLLRYVCPYCRGQNKAVSLEGIK